MQLLSDIHYYTEESSFSNNNVVVEKIRGKKTLKRICSFNVIWWLAELDIYAFAEGILDNKHNAWLQSFIFDFKSNVWFL